MEPLWTRVRPVRGLVVSLCLLLFMSSLVYATSLIKVTLPDSHARQQLLSGGYDVVEWREDYASVVAWPGDFLRLETAGFSWEIVIEDLESHYASRFDPEADDMGGYATWDEIVAWEDEFVSLYPDICAGPDTIGYGLEGRALRMLKISDNPWIDEDEPEIFLNAAIHAREVITPLILMNFAELLAQNYGSDQRITDIVNDREIWLLPVVNPDGYAYNYELAPEGGGMWRKNKRRIDDELFGVDLNRNFPFNWGREDHGASLSPGSLVYCGEDPGSEPETRAYMDFLNGHEFSVVMNYHSFTNCVYLPCNPYWLPSPYKASYYSLGRYIMETIGWPVLQSGLSGGATEWCENNADYHTVAFLLEVGNAEDGFWPCLLYTSDAADE